MSGCFSCCSPFRLWGAKKISTEMGEHQLAIVEQIPVKHESDSKISEDTRPVVPTKAMYTVATGKQALALLGSAAGAIPVPYLKDAIKVAIKIIEICEETSAVQQQLKDLQVRVSHLMIVVVDNATVRYEEGSDAVVKAVQDMEKDIKDLLSTLQNTEKDLDEIRKQHGWLKGLYKDLNMEAIESCLLKLSVAQEKFKLANDLRDSNLLLELHSRLNKISQKLDDVHKDVKHVAEAVDDIALLLIKSNQSAMMHSAMVRQQLPLKPEIFHGRDGLVEEIAQLLVKQETAHVCLLGPGGMGKTSVSLAVIDLPLIKERFPGVNRVWVPCIEATSTALLLEILYTQLQVPEDMQVTFEKIISHLNALKQPILILLDNFETPWNAPGPASQKQVEDILRQLAELTHVAIFITMRGTNPPSSNAAKWQTKNIRPTDEEACLHIYHDNNPSSKDDPDVGSLLSVLGYMPFAVTLMAKLGMEGESTAKELLEAWRESGPDILSNAEDSMNRSIRLSVESDLVKRDPNAIALLGILSLLPAGTTKQNLRWWAQDSGLKPPMIPSAIATLSKAALLVKNKRENSDYPVLFVIPVVQSFMQQHGRIDEKIRNQIQTSCCQYVLDHMSRHYDHSFPEKSKALAVEDTNIQSILFSSPHIVPSDQNVEALITFSWHRSDTKPDLDITNYAVKAAKASGVKKHIATAIWCLGWTYRQLGDLAASYDHLQKAYLLSNDPSGDAELRRLHCKCGIDAVEMVLEMTEIRHEDIGKAVAFAQDVETKCASLSDDSLHGCGLMGLGIALNAAQRQQEALVHLNRARIMLKAVNNIPYLAVVYQFIARVHYDEGRLPEALDAIREACNFFESTPSQGFQPAICLLSGLIHFSANRDTEGLEYAKTALIVASEVGIRVIAGWAWELIGYGYLRKGEYENALGAYKAALEKFRGTLNDSEASCKDNTAKIEMKLKNPDAKIGFSRTGFDVDKSLLYPSVQESATGDMPISGS